MTEVLVREIMRTDVPHLSADMPIRHAAARLVGAGSAAAPVLDDDGRLLGLLTQKDCFRPALKASYYREWTGRVADHMTCDVVWVDAETELIAAAEMFLTLPHRVFPVQRGRIVLGLLHRSDVLACLMRLG